MGSYDNSLQAKLETEFCLLDPSLIAAFISEYTEADLSPQSLKTLRLTLTELARQADQDERRLSEQSYGASMDGETSCNTDNASSANDIFSTDDSPTAISTTTSSETSSAGPQPFDSPLGFLQTVFPNVPTHRLKGILGSMAGVDLEDIDMEDVIDQILSAEYVRELQERGVDGVDGTKDLDYSTPWQVVASKKSPGQPSKKSSKNRSRATTITLVDIRQKQHARPATAPSSPRLTSATTPDPWTQVSSLASRLETLVQSRNAAFFQSYFHSPLYRTPAVAVRAALDAISPAGGCEIENQMLFGILELVTSNEAYSTLPEAEREQLLSDATLALQVTGSQPDAALDLVWLLQSLDGGSTSGGLEWGVYHSPVPPSPAFSSNATKKPNISLKLPTGPPPIPPPPIRQRTAPNLSPVSPVSPNAWKCVTPARKASQPSPPPHAQFIPAYNSKNVSSKKGKVRGAGSGIGKGGKCDVGELAYGRYGASNGGDPHSRRAGELMQQRRDALRQASRAWQKGNKKNHGGQVAAFFAERARSLQEEARQEKLSAAWEKVETTRTSSHNVNTVDLHGTTVSEGTQIVKSLLLQEPPTASKPLKVITGRGRHSANGVGVLGPAIRSALEEDGWNVGTWDAGLIVRGRSNYRGY